MPRHHTERTLNADICAAGRRGDFNEVIAIAGNTGCLDLAIDAYNHVIQIGQADPETFINMIIAAGNSNRMDLAFEAYNRAIRTKQANAMTFESIKEARENNPSPAPTTAYRLNPYSWICGWKADNRVSHPAPTGLDDMAPRR